MGKLLTKLRGWLRFESERQRRDEDETRKKKKKKDEFLREINFYLRLLGSPFFGCSFAVAAERGLSSLYIRELLEKVSSVFCARAERKTICNCASVSAYTFQTATTSREWCENCVIKPSTTSRNWNRKSFFFSRRILFLRFVLLLPTV